MEVTSIWNDLIPEKDGSKIPVNDVCFSPDGTLIVSAAGSRVLLYNAADGNLLHSLRGHKETVFSVSFSNDGTRFASGGGDNVVVIWRSNGQGLLKYSHSSPIQRVKYCPTDMILLSCSELDFGLWTPDQKQVKKEKVPSKIISCDWSSDGRLFALGMINGMISIRNQQVEELLKFERKAPIWALQFIPEAAPGMRVSSSTSGAELTFDNLAVCCWDKTYSVYKLTEKNALIQTEKHLVYYPLSLNCVYNPTMKTNYMIISGSNKQIQVLSKEGIKLATVNTTAGTNKSNTSGKVEIADSWIWCTSSYLENDTLVYGTNNGMIEYLKLNFYPVFCLYNERYAYRENLTEVIVHHLEIEKKVRIKVRDMVHHISLYRNKLAVQLLDRICIYESNATDSIDIHYRLNKDRITLTNINQAKNAKVNKESSTVSNLIQITFNHLFVALDNVVELYTLNGIRTLLWNLNSKALCITVDGGQDGKEGVLIGMEDGSVVKLYVDNPFPIEIAKRKTPVCHISLNIYRTLLATVDNEKNLIVSDIYTNENIYTLSNVKTCSFNVNVEDLLCITNIDDSVSIISGLYGTSTYSLSENNQKSLIKKVMPDIKDQHMAGTVICFKGQKIYYLNKGTFNSIDVPQGSNILSAIEYGDFLAAYKISCLGATDTELKILGMKALKNNYLEIAKNCFAQLKDIRYLDLIEEIMKATPKKNISQPKAITSTASTSISGVSKQRGARGKSNEPPQQTETAVVAEVEREKLSPIWEAEILALEGNFIEAAKLLAKNEMEHLAIQLLVTLRRWEDAKAFARNFNYSSSQITELTNQQAKWLLDIKDWKGASELFVSLGEYSQAARVIGENQELIGDKSADSDKSKTIKASQNGWEHSMIEVVRSCPIDDKETLIYCGDKLSILEDISYAKEAYSKAQDYGRIMKLLISRKHWDAAVKLADEYNGKFDMSIFLGYAEWLVSQDEYEKAMDAFKKCGRIDLSRKVLAELTENAVQEKRFKDAGYYYWLLAKEVEQEINQLLDSPDFKKNKVSGKLDNLSIQQAECEHKADLYYAYNNIHSYVTDPFTSFQPEMLFQVARLIINSLGVSDSIPTGISKTATLFTLAKQASILGTYKLARTAYERLIKLQIPDHKLDEIELDMMLIQAKPMTDNRDHLPVCYRCGADNPFLNPFNNKYANGDVCVNCGHPFVRSFINFDILPLVEFVPDPMISDEEAIELIRQPPRSSGDRASVGRGRGRERNGENADILSINNQDDFDFSEETTDLFSICLSHTLEAQKDTYIPVQVDPNTLSAMKRSEVFVCRPTSSHKRATFYKNMLPELQIAISQPCHRFFHLEDFEFAYLSEKKCPYSRLVNVGEYGSI